MSKNVVEIANQLIEGVERGGVYTPTEAVLEKLLNLCELVNTLSAGLASTSVMVDVSPEKTTSFVSFEVDDIEFEEGATHPFFVITKENASSVVFSKSRNGLLEIKLAVQNLWVKR